MNRGEIKEMAQDLVFSRAQYIDYEFENCSNLEFDDSLPCDCHNLTKIEREVTMEQMQKQ